jgi:hypothetical protein
MTTTRCTTFTTTMRVIYRVHRNTTNRGSNASPSASASFTQRTQAMFAIAYFTEYRTTTCQNLARFTGTQSQSSIATISRHVLRRSPG